MPDPTSQPFLRELDKKLWTAADKLPPGTGILRERGRPAHSYQITSTGKPIAGIPFPCSGAVSASHESAKVTDRRYTSKVNLGHARPINQPSSSSAFLCAFAVQTSSMAIRGSDFNFGKEPADTLTNNPHPGLRTLIA